MAPRRIPTLILINSYDDMTNRDKAPEIIAKKNDVRPNDTEHAYFRAHQRPNNGLT
jgi:hypothetical protein